MNVADEEEGKISEAARLPEPAQTPQRAATPEPVRLKRQRAPAPESEPAVVLPLSRAVRNEQTIRFTQPLQTGGAMAQACGASTRGDPFRHPFRPSLTILVPFVARSWS